MNQIRLYDDRITYKYNADEDTIGITDELIADIEIDSFSFSEKSFTIVLPTPPRSVTKNVAGKTKA